MPRFVFSFLLVMAATVAGQDCRQTIPAVFVDKETGAFVSGITPDLIRVKIGSNLIPVTGAEPMRSFRVLILIDASGSMEDSDFSGYFRTNALSRVKQTLDLLLSGLPADVTVEYGVFNDRALFGNDFTSNSDELRRSLSDLTKRIRHRGLQKTALFDSIDEGLTRFGAGQPGNTMLVITDGGDNLSKSRHKNVEEDAVSKGVRVFTILTLRPDSPFGHEDDIDSLRQFVDRTGGSVHVVQTSDPRWRDEKSSEPLRRDLQRFWTDEVLSGYLIHFSAPPGSQPGSKFQLSVARRTGQRSRLVASYPSRLSACPVANAAVP